ncbi:MAG TPA: glycosyltransferase family 39 protein, partial [Elainellaceae cyanobacterium]
MAKKFRALPIGLRGLILVLLILGVFFRVVNLDSKVYWHDEVFTSIRAAGYVGDEIESQLFNGTVLSADDLLVYQRLTPDKGIDDTLYALTTHPEHPPLYYLMVRGWMELFGSSVAAIRSLSVLSSLLTFPALYWLCLELFGSAMVGGMAIALFAVSPFHILYAQEARHYSLWTLATILSCAALLRA